MVNNVFQELRQRAQYVSEVTEIVGAVLQGFQADAASRGHIVVLGVSADGITGSSISMRDHGKPEISSIEAEVNATGDILITRELRRNGIPVNEPETERRKLDFSQPPSSTAVDVLLVLSDEYLGFIGNKLQVHLETKCGTVPPPNSRPNLAP